jgi:hypothetical protein
MFRRGPTRIDPQLVINWRPKTAPSFREGFSMVMRSVRRLALLLVVAIMVMAPFRASADQGSYDVIRVKTEDGATVLYRVWLTWPQVLLTTPDGGAWGFFSAQAGQVDAPNKLFVSRYDPTQAKWGEAVAVAGGAVQFGVAGAVDANGIAHVVFSDRVADVAENLSKLMYMHSNADGTWTTPVAVNDNADAGHQLAPSLAVDASGGVHVIWQDQRNVTPEQRAASPANAGIVGCDLTADGVCAADPIAISVPATADEIGNRPKLATDGQRLIATWSVYASISDDDLASASQIAWSSRPLGDPNAAWSAPQTLAAQQSDSIGGRLIDVASDPTGGVVAVYGRRADFTSLYYTRLAAGADAWSEPVVLTVGYRGSFPTVAVGADGTAFVAYNVGEGSTVTVGGVTVPAGASAPTQETELSVAEFGKRGQPVISVDNQGRVWAMYIFEPLYSGDLDANQVPNEVHVLRGASFSTEPAPTAQLNPPVLATPEAGTPVVGDGTGAESVGTPSS